MRLQRRALTLLLILTASTVLSPVAWAGDKYKVLYNFRAGSKGGPPIAAPTLDPNGDLYGPAAGGTGNSVYCSGPCGVVFKMTRGADGKWKETVALNFSTYFNDGVPDSSLIFDGQGNLYGSASLPSVPTDNWIYQLTPGASGWGFNLIYQGYGPDVGGVVADGAGNLYGELGKGVDYLGAVGELSPSPSGWLYSDLHNFCDQYGRCPDGEAPRAPFSWDSQGNLYGADYAGGIPRAGTYGLGVAFQMTPNGDSTWKYHVLHRFGSSANDGTNPWGGLVVDAAGNVYGTTYEGGRYGHGTIFKLAQVEGKWKETRLYGFPSLSLGGYPWGNLVFDQSGNLYGVANGGNVCGAYFCGEVFKLTPQPNGKWKYSVLHSFQGPDGAYPYGVVIDGKGNLFGTAWGGGTYNYGVVFEITP